MLAESDRALVRLAVSEIFGGAKKRAGAFFKGVHGAHAWIGQLALLHGKSLSALGIGKPEAGQ